MLPVCECILFPIIRFSLALALLWISPEHTVSHHLLVDCISLCCYHLKSNMLKPSSSLKKKKKPLFQQLYFYSDEGLGHVTLTKVEGD